MTGKGILNYYRRHQDMQISKDIDTSWAWKQMQHLGAAIIKEEDIRKLSTKQILNFAQATNRWKTIED